MNYRNLLTGFCIFIFFIYFFDGNENQVVKEDEVNLGGVKVNTPPCLRMYDAIHKYSTIYKIPKKYAFGIALKETGYKGPFHWKYNPSQTSYVGAIGPMQIMPSTANMTWKHVVSKTKLMNDIEFNVQTSMKILNTLYNKYKDWKIVFGCYNTGYPMVNQYAIDVYNHVPKWNKKFFK